MFKVPEKFRITNGPLASSKEDGNNGVFKIFLNDGDIANVIASDGDGWEHVSVHVSNLKNKLKGKSFIKTPSWKTMCTIKDLFWGPEDEVMQLHPPKSTYVNTQQNTLHLWRPVKYHPSIPLPPPYLVGPFSGSFVRKTIVDDLAINLRERDTLRNQWKAEFENAFISHYTAFRNATNKRTLSYDDVKHIASNAAEEYIQSLTQINHGNTDTDQPS